MGEHTTIEWTDTTWNPVTGCTEVSPGCDRCYAKGIAERFRGSKGFPNGFDVTLRPDRLAEPLKWRKPRRVFVNSMSDLFHQDVPEEFIAQVWAVMAATPQHTFQVLTKRHGRMRALLSDPGFGDLVREHWDVYREEYPAHAAGPAGWDWYPLHNVWLGVSVEDQQRANLRVPALLDTPAALRFLSCEPLLGPIELDRTDRDALVDGGLGWVIVGGESGRGARPMHPDWARGLRDECAAARIPFFFKQWGSWADIQAGGHSVLDYVTDDDRVQIVDTAGRLRGRPWPGWKVQDGTRDAAAMRRYPKHTAGRLLDGRTWDEFPTAYSGIPLDVANLRRPL